MLRDVRGVVGALSLAGLLVLAMGATHPREVRCGESCDAKMNACVKKCKLPPAGKPEVGSAWEACWDACANKEFHPCLDACKDPKPVWSEE